MKPNGVRNQVPTGDVWHPATPGNGALGLGNGGMPIVPSTSSPAPNAMNAFNSVGPFQNNPASMLQPGQQFPMVMGGQNGFPGFNAVPGQFGNTVVPDTNQIKMALQTLQFLPNVMHNLNQLLLMQTVSRPQVPPNGFLAPANPSPQIPFILGNPQYDLAHQFLQNQPQLNPNSSQQWPPGNHPPPHNAYSSQPTRLQENLVSRAGIGPSESISRGFHVRNSSRNMNGEPFRKGVQKSDFHQNNHGKRNFRSIGDRDQRTRNKFEGKYAQHRPIDQVKEQRRTLYSEQEIQQWREERKKNYPSEANIKKKSEDHCARETEVKARKEELKKILAKQAELGCEVAEIPLHYLTGNDGRRDPSVVTGCPPSKKGRFEKRDRLGRQNKRDRYGKKPRLDNTDSSQGSSVKKSVPSLLRKLLCKDMEKDKSRLLQVFKFMTMNSFFEQPAEESLRFPIVIVNDDEQETSAPEDTQPKDELLISHDTSEKRRLKKANARGSNEQHEYINYLRILKDAINK